MGNPNESRPSAPEPRSNSPPSSAPQQEHLQGSSSRPPSFPSAPSYDEPPPDYHSAVNYPSVPSYQQQQPPHQTAVKPYPVQQSYGSHTAPSYPTQNAPAPHLIYSGGYQQSSGGGAPPPPPPPGQPAVVVQVVREHSSVLRCAYCPNGVVVRETDGCCVCMLVIMMLFTFPFGLLFLLCLPCAVHNRCHQCHRIG